MVKAPSWSGGAKLVKGRPPFSETWVRAWYTMYRWSKCFKMIQEYCKISLLWCSTKAQKGHRLLPRLDGWMPYELPSLLSRCYLKPNTVIPGSTAQDYLSGNIAFSCEKIGPAALTSFSVLIADATKNFERIWKHKVKSESNKIGKNPKKTGARSQRHFPFPTDSKNMKIHCCLRGAFERKFCEGRAVYVVTLCVCHRTKLRNSFSLLK